MDPARSHLNELYGLNEPNTAIPSAVRRILEWLERYPNIVQLKFNGQDLELHYKLQELKFEMGKSVVLSNVERAFKHLKPWRPVCIQTTHGNTLWKIWRFVPSDSKQSTKELKKRVVRERADESFTPESEPSDSDDIYRPNNTKKARSVPEEVNTPSPRMVRVILLPVGTRFSVPIDLFPPLEGFI